MKTVALCPRVACALIIPTCLIVPGSGYGQGLWINEFHYDDAGSDDGEFVEVAVPAGFADLASVTLTLYNGGDGTDYGTHALEGFGEGATVGGITLYSKSIAGIQNGAPDGLALKWNGGIQFLSYEGSFIAAEGPAAGLNSISIEIAESDSGTPAGSSLGLTGSGSEYADFSWVSLASASTGNLNTGQAIIPEPGSYAFVAGLGLGSYIYWRRRHRRGRDVVRR